MEAFDYIVVGAGSAGCVLADRLTEDADVSVLLLEAGGRDRFWHWQLRMPAAHAYPVNGTRFSWNYYTEPEPHLEGRRMHCPRGRVTGGSSSINGMVYIRGNARDYNGWAEADPSLAGWDYAQCLPYFRKCETFGAGSPELHGAAGPLHVTRGEATDPLVRAFLDAAGQAGHALLDDLNAAEPEGFGPMDRTTRRGVRHSAASSHLKRATKRGNLTLAIRTQAERLLHDGRTVFGVECRVRGERMQFRARREVVLCSGPINDPQLLMLSGIGPTDHLKEHGIEAGVHLPGVGENLQDHLEIYVQMGCREPVSLQRYNHLVGKAYVGARWLFTRTGIGTSNHFEAGGFVRSHPDVQYPDLQYHFFPMAVRYDGTQASDRHGFQAHVGPMRSKSRGTVRLESRDPARPPRITFNYLSTPEDMREFRAAVRLTREIFAQRAFDRFRDGELAPGADVQTDAEVDAYVRGAVESAYHPCGTCRMGSDDLSVVDSECRVHGLDGLRIVGSAIIPAIVTGNLNAPTMMMAEKAADLIRGRGELRRRSGLPA